MTAWSGSSIPTSKGKRPRLLPIHQFQISCENENIDTPTCNPTNETATPCLLDDVPLPRPDLHLKSENRPYVYHVRPPAGVHNAWILSADHYYTTHQPIREYRRDGDFRRLGYGCCPLPMEVQ